MMLSVRIFCSLELQDGCNEQALALLFTSLFPEKFLSKEGKMFVLLDNSDVESGKVVMLFCLWRRA